MKKGVLTLCLLALGRLAMANLSPYEQGFKNRSQRLTDRVADVYAFVAPGRDGSSGSVPDPEKYNWPAVIARFHKYCLDDSVANRRINTFQDNDPFHFTFVGMARIMGQYGNAPKMQELRLKYLDEVWGRTDSYNAWTSEGTENHTNMCRTSGYLYAQYSLEHGTRYPNAGQRLADMKAWIRHYAERLYTVGNGEWNSSTYTVYSVIGWLNLHDLAKDPEVRILAKTVLDYYSAEMALHYNQGFQSGAESRGSATQSLRSGTDYLCWLWFGDNPLYSNPSGSGFFTGNDFIQSIHAVVSDYRPNAIAIKLAQKSIGFGTYKNARPSYLLDTPKEVKQNFHLSNNYTLGSACMPYAGFAGGSFQYISWKLVGRVDTPNTSAFMMTGAGNYWSTRGGRNRQPYDQFVQNKNVLIQLTRKPSNSKAIKAGIDAFYPTWDADWQRDFVQRFSASDVKLGVSLRPVNQISSNALVDSNASYLSWTNTAAIVSTANQNGVLFFNVNNRTFIAVRSIRRTAIGTPVNEGGNSARLAVWDFGPADTLCGFVVEAAEASAHASFTAFQTSYLSQAILVKDLPNNRITYTGLNGETVVADFTVNGDNSFSEPIYDWGYGPTTALVIQTSPPYTQPNWNANGIAGMGRMPSWTVNGIADNTSNYEVFNGPNLRLINRVLVFSDGNESYQVDFSGNLPVWTTNLLETGGSAKICQSAQPFRLEASQNGGFWTGAGVINNSHFDPALVAPGIATLTYTIGNNTSTKIMEVVPGAPAKFINANDTVFICQTATGVDREVKIQALKGPAGTQFTWLRNGVPILTLPDTTTLLVTSLPADYQLITKVGGAQNSCCLDVSKTITVLERAFPQISTQVVGDTAFLISNPTSAYYGITWLLNGLPVGSGSKQFLSQSGRYQARVNVGSCSDTTVGFNFIAGGLKPICQCALKVYPIPAGEVLQIEFVSDDEFPTLILRDLTGRLLKQFEGQSFQRNTWNVSTKDMASGLYMLEIQTNSGRLTRMISKN